jgi:hypothetical protein
MDMAEKIQSIEHRANLAGLSIPDICGRAGVSVATWYKWRRGGGATFSKLTAMEWAVESLLREKRDQIDAELSAPST